MSSYIPFLLLLVVGLTLLVRPLKGIKYLFFSSIFLVPVTAYFIYMNIGGYDAYHTFLAEQEKVAELRTYMGRHPDTNKVIDALKAAILKRQDDPKGWYLLGRLYAGRKSWSLALNAFEKAHQLAPQESWIDLNILMTKWQLNNQKMNPSLLSEFKQFLINNPEQTDCLYVLGYDAYVSHDNKNTRFYWGRLLSLIPPESKEAQWIKPRIS